MGSGPAGPWFLNIAASDLKSKFLESVAITTDSLFVLENNNYYLRKNKGFANGAYWNFESNSLNKYDIMKDNLGEMFITKHDVNRRILSGRFWFDATNELGEKVEVRDGRFDIVY